MKWRRYIIKPWLTQVLGNKPRAVRHFMLEAHLRQGEHWRLLSQEQGEGEHWKQHTSLRIPGFNSDSYLCLGAVWAQLLSQQLRYFEYEDSVVETVQKMGEVVQLHRLVRIRIRVDYQVNG